MRGRRGREGGARAADGGGALTAHTRSRLLSLARSPARAISFWRRAKSLEGLSVRSIVVNFSFQVRRRRAQQRASVRRALTPGHPLPPCQLIIFLYLVDNDTSWMVLMSAGMGLFIEVR